MGEPGDSKEGRGHQKEFCRWYVQICNVWHETIVITNFSPVVSNYRNNAHLTAVCSELPAWASTRKVKPISIYWSKRLQWVAMASAGPYANLHLDSRQITTPASHHSVHMSSSTQLKFRLGSQWGQTFDWGCVPPTGRACPLIPASMIYNSTVFCVIITRHWVFYCQPEGGWSLPMSETGVKMMVMWYTGGSSTDDIDTSGGNYISSVLPFYIL